MLCWSRKNALANVNGKHVTIGSTVVAVSDMTRDHSSTVKVGQKGVVVESGKANAWSSKKALGTTEAMRVQWED